MNYDAIIIGSGAGGLTVADWFVVIEEGNHNSLLAENEHYSMIYNTYFRYQSLAFIGQARNLVGDD